MLLMRLLLSGLLLLSSSIAIMRMIAVYSTNTAETTSSSNTISSSSNRTRTNTFKTRPRTCKVNDRFDEDNDSLDGFFIVTNPLVNTTAVKCDNCDLLKINDCDIVDCNSCVSCKIENATTVYCDGCSETTISNVENVYCNGKYGCSEVWIGNATSVYCNGIESCQDYTDIQAKELVECSGLKSCGSATIKARNVVCTGNEACGSQIRPALTHYSTTTEMHYTTHITSTCLVCANGGCSGSGGACFWNGTPCPNNNNNGGGIATKHCVIGDASSVKATTDQVDTHQMPSTTGISKRTTMTCKVKNLDHEDEDFDYSHLVLTNPDNTTTVRCNHCDLPKISNCDFDGCSSCCANCAIEDAKTLYCDGNGDCVETVISNVETVHCNGNFGCFESRIRNATTVYCNGIESCQDTNIQANDLIECTGLKSCAHSRATPVIIQARHVVCNGNETCGFVQQETGEVYNTHINSACLVCANGGCKGSNSGGTPTCFWNGEPCPTTTSNGTEIEHCVVGASVKATGQIIQLGAIPYTNKIMVEIDVEPHQQDPTLFRGSVRVRVNDVFSSIQGEFESTSIFLAFMKKECAIIKGTGKVNDIANEFSLTLCKAKDGNTTMDMDIDDPINRRISGTHTIADATLQGMVEMKLMVDDQNFESSQQETAIY